MSQKLCLIWKNNATSIMGSLRQLLVSQSMTDVTLMCDGGESIKAHKIVLSSCSPLFQRLFSENLSQHSCQHPVVILPDAKMADLNALLHIIYFGKVDIFEDQLLTLKKLAKVLEVNFVDEATTEKQSVSKSDKPPSKRRQRGSQKSSLNGRNSTKASGQENSDSSRDSDVEEVYHSKTPLVVGAHESFPPEGKKLSVMPTMQLADEASQKYTSTENDQSSMESLERVNHQPTAEVNVPEQDISNIKKAVETLKRKGLLPTTGENDQSSNAESAGKELLISRIEIFDVDSDIEDITPHEKPQQEQIVQLDDDEPILADDVVETTDSAQVCLVQQSTTEANKESTNLSPASLFSFANDSEINNQNIEHSSGTSKGKRFAENEMTQSVDGSASREEPPLKRRKRKRRRVSKSHKYTENSNLVLELDSDGELISGETSSSFPSASTASLNIKSSCLSQEEQPDALDKKTLTTDDVPNEGSESPVHSSRPDNSTFVHVQSGESVPEINYACHESPSGQLAMEEQLLPVVEIVQELLNEICQRL